MARHRHKITPIVASERAASKEKHAENLRYLSRKGWRGDPTNKKAVSKAAAEYRSKDTILERYSRKVSASDARSAQKAGFHVTKRGILIDDPRKRASEDKDRPQIKSRFSFNKAGGFVKFSSKARRDYIVPFKLAERKAFTHDTESALENIKELLRSTDKDFKRARKVQVRLQWGAFESRKDFSVSAFTAFMETARKVASMLRHKYGPRVKTPLDKLTGVHLVIHSRKK